MNTTLWCAGHYTDTGLKRSLNQDAVFSGSAQQLWGVADGMGGHESGDYASQLVVDRLADYRHARLPGACVHQLRSLMADCNQRLIDKARQEQADVIGCTVALLSFHGTHVTCSWSGDSRIYRLRGQRLLLLTRDHNLRSIIEDRDVQRFPNMKECDQESLTSAIGGDGTLHLEHCLYTLQQNDRFLLCTDGLCKELSDDDIRDTLVAEKQVIDVVERMATTYHERGARDNVGMVLVQNT